MPTTDINLTLSYVESVTGTAVDNTDPLNPVINSGGGITGVAPVGNLPMVASVDGGGNIVTVGESPASFDGSFFVVQNVSANTGTTRGNIFILQDTVNNTQSYLNLLLDNFGFPSSTWKVTDTTNSSEVTLQLTDIIIHSPNIALGTMLQVINDGLGGKALRSLADGSSGQVLTTDGAGTYSWATVSGGGTTTNALTLGNGISGTSFDGSAPITAALTTLTSDWDAGNQEIQSGSIRVKGTGGSGDLGLRFQSAIPSGVANNSKLFAGATGALGWVVDSNAYAFYLDMTGNTASRTLTVPNTSGTIALTSDLSSFITLSSLSASSPLSYNNLTGAFTIQVANTSQGGYLSSTDWNTFNGKGSGTVTSIGVTTANGVSGSSSGGATPSLTITLGAITPTTVNGLTITTSTGTLTVANGKTATINNTITLAGTDSTTITLPTATSTVLANNLGLSGGTTLIGGTAATDKVIFQATSGNQSSADTALFTFKGGNNGATSLFTVGNFSGNTAQLGLYFGGNSSTTNYIVRGTASVSYFNSSSDTRLQVGAADQIILNGTIIDVRKTLTMFDAINIAVGTTTGSKIGTATTQKIGFWNVTPIVQPTTSVTGASITANSGTAVNDASTFAGYTIGQVVAALRNIGLLA